MTIAETGAAPEAGTESITIEDVRRDDMGTLASRDMSRILRRRRLSSHHALNFIALVALVVMLWWARAVLVPIALAVCLRYALMPVVSALERSARLPVPVGALLVMALIVGGTAYGVAALHDPAMDMVEKLPAAAHKIELTIRRNNMDSASTMSKLNRVASEIERAAARSGGRPDAASQAKPPQPSLYDSAKAYLLNSSLGLAGLVGQAVTVLALTYFLLLAGDGFRGKLVRLSGERLGDKKVTVRILQDIDSQIQRYFLIQIVTAIVYGVATALILGMMHVENAAVWGLVAAVFHLVPYAGPIVSILLTALAGYLQFADWGTTLLLVTGLSALTALVGFGMTPWLTGKLSRMGPVTVLITLLVWGWLWGVWGFILGVPVMMAVQALCFHLEGWRWVAEMLGSRNGAVIAGETPRTPEA